MLEERNQRGRQRKGVIAGEDSGDGLRRQGKGLAFERQQTDTPFTATGPRQTAGLDMHKSVCAEVGSRLGCFSSFFFLRALLHLINIKLSGQLPSSRDPAVSGVDRVLITSPA